MTNDKPKTKPIPGFAYLSRVVGTTETVWTDSTSVRKRSLETWFVVYRDPAGITLPHVLDVFTCQAESYDHAEEQAENAYPSADILWITNQDQTSNAIEAVTDWELGGQYETGA